MNRKKLKNKQNLQVNDSDRKQKKIGKISKYLAAGVIALASIGTGYHLAMQSRQSNQQAALEKRVESEGLPMRYVEGINRQGNNPGNRDVYFLFQVHDFGGHNLDSYLGKEGSRELINSSNSGISNTQVSIYRILEKLSAQSKVGLVATEGRLNTDISTPGNFAKELGQEKMRSLRESLYSDYFLERKITENLSFGGAEWAAATLEGLYLSGWEDPKHNSDSITLINEIQGKRLVKSLYDNCKEFSPALVSQRLVERGYTEKQAEELRVQLERFQSNPAEVDKLQNEIEKLECDFEELQVQRSKDALKYTTRNADRLYREGKIKTPNVAIVIGAYHEKHYEQFMKNNKQGKNNFIYIHPAGLAKAQKK